jgi:serine-type D-Ala-D-Ala carboxypeptidase/endopeptidase (penicillin-binding protein 4)
MCRSRSSSATVPGIPGRGGRVARLPTPQRRPIPQRKPAKFAARKLIRELEDRGVEVDGRAGARETPDSARRLAETRSPAVARLAALINRPFDNYAADTMLRVLGAQVADNGSCAGGAQVIAAQIRRLFDIEPEIETGSGETIEDRTSPRKLVAPLMGMRDLPEAEAFEDSLSQAGRSGTLLRFKGTIAEGRCALKDGTRVDAVQANTTLNITGYCRSVSGRTFAFAVDDERDAARIRPARPDRIAGLRAPGRDRPGARGVDGLTRRTA